MGDDVTYTPCQSYLDDWRTGYEDWVTEHDEADAAVRDFEVAAATAVAVCAAAETGYGAVACVAAIAVAFDFFYDAWTEVEEANDAATMADTWGYNYYECMSDHKGAFEDADVPDDAEEIDEPDDSDIPDEP